MRRAARVNCVLSAVSGVYGVRPRRSHQPEPIVPGTSWTALTLEVGKSPTEVTCGRHVPRSLPSAICEFTSSSSCS